MLSEKELLQQEHDLRFKHFSNLQALVFAKAVEAQIDEEQLKPVAVRVVFDDHLVLDYRTQGRDREGWLTRKVKTVEAVKHCSLYTFIHRNEAPFDQWQTDDSYAICGGGFPLYSEGVLHGVLAVSGLDHEDDHRVLVTALAKVLQVERKEDTI